MITPGTQKLDALTLVALAAFLALAVGVAVVMPGMLPWVAAALAGAGVLVYWGVRWEPTAWAWIWVLSYGLLDWPSWLIEIPGFLNLTVPRILFLAGVFVLGVHLLVRGRTLRFDSPTFWALGILIAICALSMTATGWVARTEAVRTAPYYRFLSSLVLPTVMFLLVYSAARNPRRQIHWLLVPLFVYGWYALYLAYLQYAAIMGAGALREFIWPAYINDPEFGIHFDRARGAFGASGPQSYLLILVFFADLFGTRRSSGVVRLLLIVQALLIPPAIFFTGLRTAYLAFVLCGILWCLVGGARHLGRIKLALAGLAVLLGVVMFWGNLAQERRQTGGVAQDEPVLARLVLIEQTWEMFKDHPLTGVGFGHFVDSQLELLRDPASLSALSSGVLAQHNLFLNMLAETGVVGLVVTVAAFVLIFTASKRLYDRLPPESGALLSRDFVVLFWVALLHYITAAMFRDMLWDPFTNGLFWSFAALVAGYSRLESLEAASPSLASPESGGG